MRCSWWSGLAFYIVVGAVVVGCEDEPDPCAAIGTCDDVDDIDNDDDDDDDEPCRAELVVDPARCDFGDVAVMGGVEFCDVNLANAGTCALVLTSFAFSDETPFPSVFAPASALAVPLPIAAGSEATLRLQATPTAATTFTGALIIEGFYSDAPAAAPVSLTVPLSVRGVGVACRARVGRTDGVFVDNAAPVVAPFDEVELSGALSAPSRIDGAIVQFIWTLDEKPALSTAILSTPSAREARFTPDLFGTYAFGLDVIDDVGASATCSARVQVAPP